MNFDRRGAQMEHKRQEQRTRRKNIATDYDEDDFSDGYDVVDLDAEHSENFDDDKLTSADN
jgi:hypothetical protein